MKTRKEFTGVVARVESLRGRMAESARHPIRDGAAVDGLFESLLTKEFAHCCK